MAHDQSMPERYIKTQEAMTPRLFKGHFSRGIVAAVSVPDNIKRLRERRGMTQSELAIEVGADQVSISRWEGGARNPSMAKLRKLASVLGVELVELIDGPPQPSPSGDPVQAASPQASYAPPPFYPQLLPRDLPVLGTVLAADLEVDANGDGDHEIEALELAAAETIDYVRRPVGLAQNPSAYALYVQGVSMEPRFEQGELVYVDTRRPPSAKDYVVVQLCGTEGDEHTVVTAMIKRLARRSSQYVDLEQFNPPLHFRLPIGRVHSIHRVVRLDELLGI